MNDKERDITKVNLDEAFAKGEIFNATNEDLDHYLQHLCSGSVLNEAVRQREMNRCLVINTIKNFRFLDRIEKTNQRFTIVIVILTIVTVMLSVYSLYQSRQTTKEFQSLIDLQEQQVRLLRDKSPNPALQTDRQ